MHNLYLIKDKVGIILVEPPPDTSLGYMEVLVDPEDLELLKAWPGTWFAFFHPQTERYYFRGSRVIKPVPGYSQKQPLLHRVVARTPPGYNASHLDGNTLNCRRSNLLNMPLRHKYRQPEPVDDPLSLPLVRGAWYRKDRGRIEAALWWGEGAERKRYFIGIYPVEQWQHVNYLVGEFRKLGPEKFFALYPKPKASRRAKKEGTES